MTNLFDITIKTGDPDPHFDPDHCWIELSTATYLTETAPTAHEALTAHRWAANVLGRLAATLTDDIANERQDHQCHYANTYQPGCHIAGTALTPATIDDLTDSPVLSLWVPPNRLRHWTRHTKQHLTEILKTDRWQPTPDDEDDWSTTTLRRIPEHMAAPLAVATLDIPVNR